MHGPKIMWTGEGFEENYRVHQEFRDAIPDYYPDDWTIEQRAAVHPAWSGWMVDTMIAADYRRAHHMHGPMSKQEHAALEAYQALTEETGIDEQTISFGDWWLENQPST